MKKSNLFARLRWNGALAGLALVAACASAPEPEERGETAILALTAPAAAAKVSIVQFHAGVDVDAAIDDLAGKLGLGVMHRYRHALKGGALLVPAPLLAKLLADPRVRSVEPDQPVQAIAAQTVPTGVRLIGADGNPNQGAGLHVAVLDTGIDLDHPDLVANLDLAYAKDCVNEAKVPKFDDRNGHGSHVAGTVAAVDNGQGVLGVARSTRVVPVKVLNRRGSGSWATIICGIDHVTANASVLRVANMSLGGSGSECSGSGCTKSALQIAVEKSVAAGVTYAVAAGNSGVDAKTSVPAAYDAVITVSAYSDADGVLGSGDGWASFSNYGADVDLATPGVSILSTYRDAQYATLSGTSMASPHVAGACALYLASHPTATPADVRDGLRAAARTTYPASGDPKHAEPLLDATGL